MADLKKKAIYFYVATALIPTVIVIVSAAMETYAFGSGGLPFCFIASKVMNDVTIDIALFFAEEAILVGISMIMLIISIIQIWVVHKLIKKASVTKSADDVRVGAMRRVAVFITILCAIMLIILQWRFNVESEGLANVQARVARWTMCKVKIELGLPDAGECPGDRTPVGASYGLVAALTFLNGTLGIFFFLNFGLIKENYEYWGLIYNFVRERKWSSIWQLVTRGKKSFESAGRDKSTTPTHRSSNRHSSHSPNSSNNHSSQQISIAVSNSSSSGESKDEVEISRQ